MNVQFISTSKVREFKGESLLSSLDCYTIIDIETTGLDPKVDKIIELAGIKVKDNQIIDTFSSLINPEEEIDNFITVLTGINNEMVKNAPTIEEKIEDFLNFIGDDVIVGHNVNFDINFIYDNSLMILSKPLENDYIDTLRFCRKYIESDNHKLSTMAKKFNIDYTDAHRALKDCHITYHLYNILKEITVNEASNDDELLKNFIPPINNIFDGKTIVLKGKFENYDYNFLVDIAIKCNVKNVTDILYKNKTDYVVFSPMKYKKYLQGEGGEIIQIASELEKKKKLKILSEEEFLKINNIPLKKKENHIRKKISAKDITVESTEFDTSNPFYNKECVFTGALEKMSRKECMQLIANMGGKNRDNVTKDTNYLILGNNDYNPILRGKKSNKLLKAEKYKLDGFDIEILSESTFYDLIQDYDIVSI